MTTRERKRRWSLLTRNDITFPNEPDNILLRRLRLVQTPLFGLYLHKHLRPDADRELHDHPWTFWSLVLWGGYTEKWASDVADAVDVALYRGDLERGRVRGPDGRVLALGPRPARLVRYAALCKEGRVAHRTWRPGSLHRIRLGEFHSIRHLRRTPTWTLLLVGPRREPWGFATAEEGWLDHISFEQRRPAA